MVQIYPSSAPFIPYSLLLYHEKELSNLDLLIEF